MKKLLLTVSALAALSLLAPSTGFAYNNQVGFYNDLNQTAAGVEGYTGVPFSIYVMIHNPYNTNSSTAVANLGGFEFIISLPAGAFVLGSSYPVQALNVGIAAGEYIVGFGQPLPVTPGTPTLVLTLNVLAGTSANQYIYLTETTNPSIPGEIVLLDFDTSDIIPMYIATGGDIANPIFSINADVPLVAVEDMSFDSVKALYR